MFLEIYYHIQQAYKKALVREHAASKDRTKSLDDYLQGKERNEIKYINEWFRLFIDHYNKEIIP